MDTEPLSWGLDDKVFVVTGATRGLGRATAEALVANGARVVERGTHEELLAGEGRYAHLYRTQFADEPLSVH